MATQHNTSGAGRLPAARLPACPPTLLFFHDKVNHNMCWAGQGQQGIGFQTKVRGPAWPDEHVWAGRLCRSGQEPTLALLLLTSHHITPATTQIVYYQVGLFHIKSHGQARPGQQPHLLLAYGWLHPDDSHFFVRLPGLPALVLLLVDYFFTLSVGPIHSSFPHSFIHLSCIMDPASIYMDTSCT